MPNVVSHVHEETAASEAGRFNVAGHMIAMVWIPRINL